MAPLERVKRACGLAGIRAITKLVGLGRVELPTSRLSSARSNQLSYRPITLVRLTPHLRNIRAGLPLCDLKERETKTAVSRIMGPDFGPLFYDDPIETEVSEGSSLERR